MPVTEVKSFEEFKKLINSDRVSVFDFWATWCGPCKMIAPVYSKFSDLDEFKDIDFYKVDTEEVEEAMMEAGVTAMPTFLVFQNGDKKGTALGANPKGLQDLLKQSAALAAAAPAKAESKEAIIPAAAPPAVDAPPKTE